MSAIVETIGTNNIHPVPDSSTHDIDTNIEREKLLSASRMQWFHWLVVTLSILLTLSAWYISKEQIAKTSEARFLQNAGQVVALVKERIELYENALWGAVALIDSNKGNITYPQWMDYANSLHIDEVYPGINGIGVIYNIRPDQLEAFLSSERQLRPGFDLHPKHNESEYWPITYVEPTASNSKAIGLDIAFESNRYSSVKNARDLGVAQLTGPITLVQDARKTPGFLFYTPFYKNGSKPDSIESRRENIVGVTYAPFIVHKLMEGTLASENRYVSITLTDQQEVLYEDESYASEQEFDPSPMFSKVVNINLYGREWSFQIDSNLSFRNAESNSQPVMILLGGVFINSMLLALFLFLTRANRRALCYADTMNRQLQIKTASLVKSNEDLEQFAYIASHDLKSPINAIRKLVDWIEEDMGDDIPETSRDNFRLLRSRSDRMNNLLDDLLNYARIGKFGNDSELFHLKSVTESILEDLDIPQQIRIEVIDFELSLPRVPFELVIRNLISNAIKHHDKDVGLIRLGCEIQNNYYLLRVEDDGPGIPPEMHDKVLEMFRTLQSRDNVEGSGMGLAMVTKILGNYNGKLKIESDGLRGTSIIIKWPCAN